MNTKNLPCPGKAWGLRRLASADGHFTMLALDQRPPIINLIAQRRGIAPEAVAFTDIVAVKRAIVQKLAGDASAVLFDPNYAIPAGIADLSPRTGLLLTLEDHRTEESVGGRRTAAIANWDVAKIRRTGGDGVKVLIWYRPDASADVIAHQQAFVQEVGQQCIAHDIPFVLELLVFPFSANQPGDADYTEAPNKQPQLVLDSVREFSHPRYGVDLFKLESPLAGALLPERNGSAAHLAAQAHFDEMGQICRDASLPWVMLSAGVTAEQFVRVMQYAYSAGANGFLAGRAIWWEAMQQFPDLAACRAALETTGANTFQALIELTRRNGHRWQPDYRWLSEIGAEGDVARMIR